jgi:DNA-binding transcriptional LysR family regulator
MNLHQLRVFLTVAQSLTLTRASKRLGLAQPSVSNQLAGLESSIGTRLFERGHNRMVLTDAGQVLLRHAQSILREVDEAEAVLREFAVGKRVIVRVAGLNSVIKALLPNALISCDSSSGMEVDIEEASPREVLEMLYSRQAHIGLIAADSVAQTSVGFPQVSIVEDPYVFAVPSSIDFDAMDVNSAPADVGCLLNRCVLFNFGTQHTLQVQQWYQRVLPSHRIVARCRTYEVAIELVRAGLGVSLVPALTALLARGSLDGIKLFATDHGSRRIVAVLADQYLRLTPYKQLIEALQVAGRNVVLPPILPMPRLIKNASEGAHPLGAGALP